jgi:DNA invertase Pin-like site-specific DNA recombinase
MSRITKFGKRSLATQQSLACNRCVLYVRASTPEQVNSLDAQQTKAAEFAKVKDLIIEKTFVDSGVSAVHYGIRERPEARRMFAYIKKHGIATILVLRLDRAFRSSLDFSLTTTQGIQEGFHFRFLQPDIDYGTPMGRMFAQMEASRAEMECELRSQRVDDAYDSLRERRIARTNQAPYGWRLGPPSESISRISKKPLATLIPIPAEQAVLRHIQDIYQHGPGKPYGKFTAIAELLNSHGIPTKTPAGTVMRRTYRKGTPQERSVEILTDGQWKHVTVKSVLAHAVLAADAELPDGIPTFQQAIAMLKTQDGKTQDTRQDPPSPAPSVLIKDTILADF